MEASLQAGLCNGLNPPSDCPEDESAAQRLTVGIISCLLGAFGALGFFLAWGLGETSDWASDLQTYNEVPKPAADWKTFKKLAVAGEDPKADHTRNGNWTEMDCTHEMIVDSTWYTPSERWKTLNADAAWADVVGIWKDTDKPRGIKFIDSVSDTLNMGADSNCGQLTGDSCVALDYPAGANGDTSGPAAQLIWNSLVKIHMLHKDYHDTLFETTVLSSTALDDLENNFAPIPPEEDKTWLLLLIDFLTLGTLGTAGPFFNTLLKRLSYILEKSSTPDNLKDTTMTIVGQSTTIAKDVLPSDDSIWSPALQDAFSNYMGQVIGSWANVTTEVLDRMFKGTPEALDLLEDIISNGKLTLGKFEEESPDDDTVYKNDLRTNIQKCFFGYSIPALWQVSKAYSFIIHAGHDCGGKELTDYLTTTQWTPPAPVWTGSRLFQQQILRAPPGLDSLGDGKFGAITKSDLIKGSVRTWKQNGKANGGGFADPTNQGTIDNLLDVDVTTPGFMRIPVCSPERAYKSWDTLKAGSGDNYPCDIQPGKDECGDSTFENETSGASPLVDDCLTIIKNIEEDASTDFTTQVVGKNQRELLSFGTCAFGVEATKVNGNVNFVVGGQDVIDIINESIKQFATDGRVGAKGNMECNSNTSKRQPVLWGLY
ncbi:hypothetical protein N7520_007127 [Penicillium odoratum]|uniref:uncharacterized protein n=1 Tax=Penicillium odoratum TaxID=1167516 RepID=UPI0025484561|nr:uncharacterized protein N7520_007127 [Penicillium odoratum]KAJ5759971.1 hypothetical protein N7520_007127 [Penicillium odoratum]